MREATDRRLRQGAILLGLMFLVAAAVLVWTQRLTISAGASGEKHYEDLVFELDQKLRAEHGNVCGEMISVLPDGESKPHGLVASSDLPSTAVNVLAENSQDGLEAFERRSIDASGITLISEDGTSEMLAGGSQVLGSAVKLTFVAGGQRGTDRWEVTDEAYFYMCPSST